MKNKKGFTLVEMLAVIIILGIILVLAVGAYSKYILKGEDKSFELAANSMRDAAESAMDNCRGIVGKSSICTTHSLDKITTSDKIYLNELIQYEFLDDVKNPYKSDEYCSNSSYVEIKPADSIGMEFTYKACLICGNHRSKGCE